MIDNQKQNFYAKIVILKMHKNVQNVKIKSVGNAQTTPPLQQGMKQSVVIQNQIARLLVCQQLDQAFRRADSLAEDRQNKVDVLSGKLDPAIRLNYSHHLNSHSTVRILRAAVYSACANVK